MYTIIYLHTNISSFLYLSFHCITVVLHWHMCLVAIIMKVTPIVLLLHWHSDENLAIKNFVFEASVLVYDVNLLVIGFLLRIIYTWITMYTLKTKFLFPNRIFRVFHWIEKFNNSICWISFNWEIVFNRVVVIQVRYLWLCSL